MMVFELVFTSVAQGELERALELLSHYISKASFTENALLYGYAGVLSYHLSVTFARRITARTAQLEASGAAATTLPPLSPSLSSMNASEFSITLSSLDSLSSLGPSAMSLSSSSMAPPSTSIYTSPTPSRRLTLDHPVSPHGASTSSPAPTLPFAFSANGVTLSSISSPPRPVRRLPEPIIPASPFTPVPPSSSSSLLAPPPPLFAGLRSPSPSPSPLPVDAMLVSDDARREELLRQSISHLTTALRLRPSADSFMLYLLQCAAEPRRDPEDEQTAREQAKSTLVYSSTHYFTVWCLAH
jgi:hypothetical protein